jgi:hypothetical protein
MKGEGGNGRGWTLITMVFGLVLGVVGTVSAQLILDRINQPTPATDLRRFIPPTVASGGTVTVGISHRVRAACTRRGSLVDPERVHARRCETADGESYDPCFANTLRDVFDFGDYVCFKSPWPRQSFKGRPILSTITVRLTGHLPEVPGPRTKRFRAWAMELSDGIRCIRQLGLGPAEPAETLYDCIKNDKQEGWIVAFPDDDEDTWYVDYVDADDSGAGSTRRRVVRAWW